MWSSSAQVKIQAVKDHRDKLQYTRDQISDKWSLKCHADIDRLMNNIKFVTRRRQASVTLKHNHEGEDEEGSSSGLLLTFGHHRNLFYEIGNKNHERNKISNEQFVQTLHFSFVVSAWTQTHKIVEIWPKLLQQVTQICVDVCLFFFLFLFWKHFTKPSWREFGGMPMLACKFNIRDIMLK